jgi:diketogulonate reductase-like aldo/keto reductase
VNQIEFHPYSLPTYLPTLLPLCKKHNVLIECYAPLMSIVRHPGGPVDDAVAEVVKSRGLGETDGQVLLMWAQQVTGGVVIT